MPRYKITQHLTGWKVVENYIDAKDEDEAWKKHDQDDYVDEEWREAEEEYKVTDTEINFFGLYKKWREGNEKR
jgi:hypothetical protein